MSNTLLRMAACKNYQFELASKLANFHSPQKKKKNSLIFFQGVRKEGKDALSLSLYGISLAGRKVRGFSPKNFDPWYLNTLLEN